LRKGSLPNSHVFSNRMYNRKVKLIATDERSDKRVHTTCTTESRRLLFHLSMSMVPTPDERSHADGIRIILV
jgi:hypothetical protein